MRLASQHQLTKRTLATFAFLLQIGTLLRERHHNLNSFHTAAYSEVVDSPAMSRSPNVARLAGKPLENNETLANGSETAVAITNTERPEIAHSTGQSVAEPLMSGEAIPDTTEIEIPDFMKSKKKQTTWTEEQRHALHMLKTRFDLNMVSRRDVFNLVFRDELGPEGRATQALESRYGPARSK